MTPPLSPEALALADEVLVDALWKCACCGALGVDRVCDCQTNCTYRVVNGRVEHALKTVPPTTRNAVNDATERLLTRIYNMGELEDDAKLVAQAVKTQAAQIAELEAALNAGAEYMRQAWHEMNAIRARDGAPAGISEKYWAELTDALSHLLGDDNVPWMLRTAREIIAPYEARAEAAERWAEELRKDNERWADECREAERTLLAAQAEARQATALLEIAYDDHKTLCIEYNSILTRLETAERERDEARANAIPEGCAAVCPGYVEIKGCYAWMDGQIYTEPCRSKKCPLRKPKGESSTDTPKVLSGRERE